MSKCIENLHWRQWCKHTSKLPLTYFSAHTRPHPHGELSCPVRPFAWTSKSGHVDAIPEKKLPPRMWSWPCTTDSTHPSSSRRARQVGSGCRSLCPVRNCTALVVPESLAVLRCEIDLWAGEPSEYIRVLSIQQDTRNFSLTWQIDIACGHGVGVAERIWSVAINSGTWHIVAIRLQVTA